MSSARPDEGHATLGDYVPKLKQAECRMGRADARKLPCASDDRTREGWVQRRWDFLDVSGYVTLACHWLKIGSGLRRRPGRR